MPTHIKLLDLTTVTILDENINYEVSHYVIISTILLLNFSYVQIFSSALRSYTASTYTYVIPLEWETQVALTYKTTGKIMWDKIFTVMNVEIMVFQVLTPFSDVMLPLEGKTTVLYLKLKRLWIEHRKIIETILKNIEQFPNLICS
jgi:hypothetical protein